MHKVLVLAVAAATSVAVAAAAFVLSDRGSDWTDPAVDTYARDAAGAWELTVTRTYPPERVGAAGRRAERDELLDARLRFVWQQDASGELSAVFAQRFTPDGRLHDETWGTALSTQRRGWSDCSVQRDLPGGPAVAEELLSEFTGGLEPPAGAEVSDREITWTVGAGIVSSLVRQERGTGLVGRRLDRSVTREGETRPQPSFSDVVTGFARTAPTAVEPVDQVRFERDCDRQRG